MRIKDRAQAEAIAKAAAGFRGPLSVSVEEKRQAPPRLFDLPSLQKTCGQRWGWTADKTLAIAQELYDGDGKKLITYPRAEARYLSENQIHDVAAIVAALTRLRGFAHLEVASPVIRRGKSGHFCDKALEGVSHHAIVPNVNVLDDLESRLVRLNDDEKRLFALICRSYLAIIMPDYEYRQTVVTMPVPLPNGSAAEFRAIGRVPLRLGWKAVFQTGEAEPDSEAAQTLPPIEDGDAATLSETKVEAKRTQPPPRYSEGTLVDAMQNAWRFVEDPALRDRLKEAKGIGTPATRAEIIKGLKRQNLLITEGKLVAPTPAGLQLFELLRASAPALVDPGTTALWEMRLDEVVTGKTDFRAVINGIAAAAADLIDALQKRPSATINLESSAQARRSGRRRYSGKTTNRTKAEGQKPSRTQRRSTKSRAMPKKDFRLSRER
jgi:DNA topoisomerase-3